MRPLVLATEDVLSEAVGRRLVVEANSGLTVAQALGRRGFGYLRSKVRNFCELARVTPVLLLTDLDDADCPPALIEDWADRDQVPPLLLFRVAVRQIESWLLADREGVAGLLGINAANISRDPDALPDAKSELLRLAQRARRDVKGDLVKQVGSIAAQGIGYNAVLCDFVRTRWNPTRAAGQSNSLARARKRLADLAAAG